MLPEVKEWVDAEDDYDSEYERRLQKIRDDNLVPRWSNSWTTEERSAWYEADAKQKTAEVEFDHYKRERRMVALDKLKNSDDKLINWLMNHRGINRDYTSYRNAVLKALPMSREEMEGFGDRQGWCEEYTELLASAQAAGVLPEPVPPLANINELVRELREVVGGRERRMRSVINKHLPAILESARQIAVENAVKAEAEAEAARANDTTSGNTKRATTATGRTRTATVAA